MQDDCEVKSPQPTAVGFSRHRGAIIISVPLLPNNFAATDAVANHDRCCDVGGIYAVFFRRHGLFFVVGHTGGDLWAIHFLDPQIHAQPGCLKSLLPGPEFYSRNRGWRGWRGSTRTLSWLAESEAHAANKTRLSSVKSVKSAVHISVSSLSQPWCYRRGTAVLKSPQSKRFATAGPLANRAQRLDCGG
jgi:hypothetical protein